ncbi:hypothetical protein H920_15343 [Fukomys damarensis]|uniref:Uncharacterized protein n=1 Tax=Fukomys damarensis TaxID=885580 RepID=A0A091CY51_FUKDA|nr:hypothetical protein H920_15343 [Fukomys damarensis]
MENQQLTPVRANFRSHKNNRISSQGSGQRAPTGPHFEMCTPGILGAQCHLGTAIREGGTMGRKALDWSVGCRAQGRRGGTPAAGQGGERRAASAGTRQETGCCLNTVCVPVPWNVNHRDPCDAEMRLKKPESNASGGRHPRSLQRHVQQRTRKRPAGPRAQARRRERSSLLPETQHESGRVFLARCPPCLLGAWEQSLVRESHRLDARHPVPHCALPEGAPLTQWCARRSQVTPAQWGISHTAFQSVPAWRQEQSNPTPVEVDAFWLSCGLDPACRA